MDSEKAMTNCYRSPLQARRAEMLQPGLNRERKLMIRRTLTSSLIALLLAVCCGCATPPKDAASDALPDMTGNSVQPPPVVERAKLPPTTPQPGDGPAEMILRDAVAWFDDAATRIDALVPVAEAAADRLIAGGRLYAAGSPGFIAELYGRAGGPTCLVEWTGQTLTENDVLIIGQLRPREEVNSRRISTVGLLAGGGWNLKAQVVHVSSHRWPQMSRLIPLTKTQAWGGRLTLLDTGAPAGGSWSEVSLDQMASAAVAHAFLGEVFSALTRRGRTMSTYASYAEPNGDAWDKAMGESVLNPRIKLAPIPAGKVAREYYLTCQRQIGAFLAAGMDPLRGAAARLANATKNSSDASPLAPGRAGGEGRVRSDGVDAAVFLVMGGHIHVPAAIIPGEWTNWIVLGRNWEWKPAVIRPNDVLFYFGYLEYPAKPVQETLDAGGAAVTFAVDEGPTDAKRIHVRTHWEKWDSCVNVGGYPIRLLASSGVVGTPQWYALIAEIEKAMRQSPH
jgi:hypothetical protein